MVVHAHLTIRPMTGNAFGHHLRLTGQEHGGWVRKVITSWQMVHSTVSSGYVVFKYAGNSSRVRDPSEYRPRLTRAIYR
jgi:hypothetical protein